MQLSLTGNKIACTTATTTHTKSSVYAIFHDSQELDVTQLVVAVRVEQGEDGADHVVAELLAGGDLHGAFELSCNNNSDLACSASTCSLKS